MEEDVMTMDDLDIVSCFKTIFPLKRLVLDLKFESIVFGPLRVRDELRPYGGRSEFKPTWICPFKPSNIGTFLFTLLSSSPTDLPVPITSSSCISTVISTKLLP